MRDGGKRMGTQKGRVDVQQQLPSFLPPSHPPSLLQTPQLPGAATARPEVTRLLPTTRLRLALPLSISLLPPSFVRPLRSPCFSQSSLSPAHHHPPPTRASLHHCHLHAYTLGGCCASPFPSASLFRSCSLSRSVPVRRRG